MHTFWITDTELDTEQAQAVKGVPANSSFLMKGPAGSGKTNILLLRAKWLKLKKISEFKIVVFTASLKTFVREGCDQYGIPEETVVTANQLLKDLLTEYNIDYEITNDFETDRSMLAGKAMSLIDEYEISNIYEAIMIDESQDYMDTELLIFRKLTPRLILAADSRQSIYRTTHTPNFLEKLVDNNTITLKYHYRSGLSICNVADHILKDSVNFPPMRGECKYNETAKPSSVFISELPSFTQQINEILTKIPSQLSLYPGEHIGVLFPKKEQVHSFKASLALAKISESERVWVDTLHGGKGWEFRAVHIGGCESLYKMGPTQKRLAYTGILRAKTSVNVYYTGKIPGYLESAIASISPPPAEPELSDLFGAK